MGLFDKLFGLSLVIAGVTIGIYFTLWTLMVLVSRHMASSSHFDYSQQYQASFHLSCMTFSSIQSGSLDFLHLPLLVELPLFHSGSRRHQLKSQRQKLLLQLKQLQSQARKCNENYFHANNKTTFNDLHL